MSYAKLDTYDTMSYAELDTYDNDKRKEDYTMLENICFIIFLFFIFIFITILMTNFFMFVFPAPSPTIIVNNVKIYAFNVSTTTSTLTSNLLVTLSCRNHDFTGFHLDNINVYVLYKRQQITPPTIVVPMYLDLLDVTGWSPSLNGTEVQMTPSLALALAQDKTAGNMFINVKVTAQVTWKSGLFVVYRRRLRFKVSCPVHIKFGNMNDSDRVIGSAVMDPFVGGCVKV